MQRDPTVSDTGIKGCVTVEPRSLTQSNKKSQHIFVDDVQHLAGLYWRLGSCLG